MTVHLRVMTYNIRTGRNHPDGLEAVARVIEAAAPDIVGLQEVDNATVRSGGVDQTRWLAQRLDMPHNVYGASLGFFDGGEYGNALLSRYPILVTDVRHLRPLGEPSPVSAGDEKTWLDAHEARSALGAVVDVEGRRVNLFVTHLGLTQESRLVQIPEAIEFARNWQAGSPALVIGDFNAWPDAPEIALMLEAFDDAMEAKTPEQRVTRVYHEGGRHPAGTAVCLDYVFVGPGITIEDACVFRDETDASDHQPVLVTVVPGVA